MPWKPPAHENPPYDRRLEACRDRAAHLRHADGREAMLYCRVIAYWTHTGGHLWWRRWSPPQFHLEGHWMEDGQWSSDFLSSGEDLAETLNDFDRGLFTFLGEQWQVHWLDDDASRTFREQHGFELSES
ncbi:hypothetical protein [Kineococcus xinjiangensis]|nr:hypothetical protein [Kineococcus xinjiangensis]